MRIKEALRGLIGTRSFYKSVLLIAVPVMIQMGITNFVSLLDNIMVGTLGEESMSGVAIINQFIFIFTLAVFGAISAAGIFTAQFHGKGDVDGVRSTFRLKIMINLAVGIIGTLVMIFFGDALINAFLHDDGSGADLAVAFDEAKTYLTYIVIGLIPYSLTQAYASTLKETEQTVVPMVASICAVATNFVLNLVLIFGFMEIPAMGVKGAAIATTVSRFVELLILVIWTHTHTDRCPYAGGLYTTFKIPVPLLKIVSIKGLPLLFNELAWSMAITLRNQFYSTRGLDALAATSISTTIINMFSVVYMALGTSVAIMVGNKLGAGDVAGAKDTSKKLIAFSFFTAICVGSIIVATAPLFPKLYDVSVGVREIATFILIANGILVLVQAVAHSSYFTIRSGGRVLITVLLDCGFMWGVVIPFSLAMTYLTPLDIRWLFVVCQSTEIIKVIIGFIILKKANWAKKLV